MKLRGGYNVLLEGRPEAAGVERCVACGLCSFVCPSKIELRQEFLEAQERIREGLHVAPEQAEETGVTEGATE